ncbi:MAG TPA: energy-coupling factor transporter transmembrane component T [Solirubrobacteraceae bacterium]|jgi:energy-coupling factor transport system permease protein|nr:energy-coupling factor transporter transmembrane component T [Solirubrobacteraceae bacterium]
MIYRPRASPLHAARAAVAIAWCAALAVAALIESNPLVLGAVTLAALVAGGLAGVDRELRRCLRWTVPLWLTITAINALVTRDGLTVIWRLGEVPVLGQTNVTLEATVYGAVLGLRAVALVLIATLYSVAVDPDNVLRLFRRLSFSSALSATIATRMVPVLIRDSRRLAEAQRCRPGPPPGRAQLLLASTAGVLDRALDVAATLEVRGYGAARQRARGRRRDAGAPWSRHDIAFLTSAAVVVAIAVAARIAGWEPFHAYPLLRAPAGARTLSVAAALAVAALAPFCDRRGIER